MTTAPPSTPRLLTEEELLDLFKHWDTRVSHQELLFIPLAAAALPAAAATWDKLDALLVSVMALGSLGVYLYHLFAIRRLAVFQQQIFAKLRTQYYRDWADIVDPQGRLGVQRLRLIGLPVLASLWVLALFAKLHWPAACWWIAIALPWLGALTLTGWLWREADRDT